MVRMKKRKHQFIFKLHDVHFSGNSITLLTKRFSNLKKFVCLMNDICDVTLSHWQGRSENSRGPGHSISGFPMKSLFSNDKT